MRVSDKPELKGGELFEYLKANKSRIIAEKTSTPIKSDPLLVDSGLEFFKEGFKVKESGEGGDDPNSIFVKVVANMCMLCDSHMDVLGTNSSKKTIKERKGKIPHIRDHVHKIEAKIAKVKDIYLDMVDLKKIGVKSEVKEAQAIIMESDVKRSFNNQLFELYKADEVNQHSIGLQYVKMELAINSEEEDYKQEKKVWAKHIDQIINKEHVESRGYFWYVSEIKLFENSAVLFGSNELTPTLEVGKGEPFNNTHEENEPPIGTQEDKTNYSLINFM